MGKRSRKRSPGAVEVPERPSPPASQRRPPATARSGRRPGQSRMDRFIERADERPKPPWHPVPLVELAVLVGLVLLVVGLINSDTSTGRLAVLFGLALASLAGLETAAREHFTGYRSHSTLLAGVPAIVTVIALAVLGVLWGVMLVAAALVFGIAFWALRAAFRRRAGVAFKV